ncbi:NAD(P)-binding protein [Dentipellis sp. KUC8613]|nr:NAD(P)-binding protein [Dentipellis sp. KUC8613]
MPPTIADAKCVLVIGATAGIGRELALKIHALPSHPTVIVAGRRQERLAELASLSEKDGRGKLITAQLDINAERDVLVQSIRSLIEEHPELDAVIFSAAIQFVEDFRKPEEIDLDALSTEINMNYTAVVTMMVKGFLPHFLKLGEQGRDTFLVLITSSLAIVPAPWVANYSATKAAIHSLCLAMRVPLKEKNIHVIELSPPLVESELHDHQGTTPALSKIWMPLDEFIPAAMEGLLRGDPHIAVGRANGLYEQFEKDKMDTVQKFFDSRRDL